MKKYIAYLMSAATLIGILNSCEDDRDQYENADGKFVRFHMILDKNNQPIAYGVKEDALIEATTYEHSSTYTVKIPVALTAHLQGETKVDFTYSASNAEAQTLLDDGTLSINPTQQLTFNSTKLVDTIYVKLNKRISISDAQSAINFKLTKVSDPSITLGYPGRSEEESRSQFSLKLTSTAPTIIFFNTDKIQMSGEQGEKHTFFINFSQPFLPSEVEGLKFLIENSTGYSYQIEQSPYQEGDTSIKYTFTSQETFSAEQIQKGFRFMTVNLTNAGSEFQIEGLDRISFEKTRDFPVNPQYWDKTQAKAFDLNVVQLWLNSGIYNGVLDRYTLYYNYWNDKDGNPATNDGRWTKTFFLSMPTVLSSNDVNADANGNSKFQIDFVGNKARPELGTNIFAMTNMYTNLASDSKGKRAESMLNFYPAIDTENSTAEKTYYKQYEGTIEVFTTALVVKNKDNDKEYIIEAEGSGNYYPKYDVSGNLIGLVGEVTLKLDETSIGGKVETYKYVLYNYDPKTNYPPDEAPEYRIFKKALP